MKAIKVIFALGGVLLAIAVGVFIYVLINLNQFVKTTVEREGPEITKTSVTLDDVDVSIFQGGAELNDLTIGNPSGYKSDYLLRWDRVKVDTDPLSLKEEVIVLENVVIEGVKINAEQKGYTTNLQTLLKNLQSDSKNEEPATTDSGKPILLAVKQLKFADNSINFITEEYGNYQLNLPSFELANLGSSNKGLTPAQLGKAILEPLVQQAKRSVEDRLKDAAKEKLNEKLDEKKEELDAKVDEKKSELKEKLNEEAGEKLKNLFDR